MQGRNAFFRITPDEANTLCVFAVNRGVNKRLDVAFNNPQYDYLVDKLRNKFGNKLKTLGEIADVICGPFGSAIKNTDYQESGIPLIRITNITKDGQMDYSDLVFISEELGNSLSKTQVTTGDIVISQRGSLGQCAVIDNQFEKLNISANIIAIKNIRQTTSKFIRNYICSNIGQKLLEQSVSGQVQQKITTRDIAEMVIPILDLNIQNNAVNYMNDAFALRKEKIKQANELISISQKQVFEALGIDLSEYAPSLYSKSTRGTLKEMGVYCNPHSDYLNTVFARLRVNKNYAGDLENFVEVNPATSRKDLYDSNEVSFVPMPNVTEKTNEVKYERKKYSEVKIGFTVFQKGDLLWAKITPCMQNGKSFLAENMPTEIGFGSTEFHVLRKKSDKIYMPFLWVMLSDTHILEAAQGMFGGSAGQQRVPDTFLKKFPIVLPPVEIQKTLADNVFNALLQAKHLREQAEKEWQEAKAQFEKELLGV